MTEVEGEIEEPYWWQKAEEHEYKTSLPNPYDFEETVNWVMKHLVVDFIWPIVFFLILVWYIGFGLMVSPIALILLVLTIVGLMANYIVRITNRFKTRKELDNIGTAKKGWFRARHFEEVLNVLDPSKKIYKIGFVGDIMKRGKKGFVFDRDIHVFFWKVDLIVGNLEGIIAQRTKLFSFGVQDHSPDIFDTLLSLRELTPELQWLLSISNNHSGDFGFDRFHATWEQAQNTDNIFIFGRRDVPNFTYGKDDEINFVCGTRWHNKKDTNYVSRDQWKNRAYKKGAFNILYPHWNYENESYIRKKVKVKCENLLLEGDDALEEQPWDLIFGHHSHVPQPIVAINDDRRGVRKLLAYSGGNFTSSKGRKKHIKGLIARCEIGTLQDNPQQLAVGKVEWSYVINKKNTVSLDKKRNRNHNAIIPANKVVIGIWIFIIVNGIFFGIWLLFQYGIL